MKGGERQKKRENTVIMESRGRQTVRNSSINCQQPKFPAHSLLPPSSLSFPVCHSPCISHKFGDGKTVNCEKKNGNDILLAEDLHSLLLLSTYYLFMLPVRPSDTQLLNSGKCVCVCFNLHVWLSVFVSEKVGVWALIWSEDSAKQPQGEKTKAVMTQTLERIVKNYRGKVNKHFKSFVFSFGDEHIVYLSFQIKPQNLLAQSKQR